MLPYDGEPVHAPSTSAWQWDAAYSLYFNPTTQQWAKPRPDGGWDYAGGVATEAESQPEAAAEAGDEGTRDRVTTTTSRSRRAQVGYGDVDEGNPPPEGAPAVPEDQRWPGSPSRSPSPSPPDPFAHAPLLRLVVHRRPPPSVLPPPQSVASLDPAEPVSIGRDKSFERRIRLRELAVSKTHCTLFWAVEPEADDRGYWAVVDNASTHGTFVGGGERGHSEVRLSEPKVASVPSRLHHLDTIRVGSTTFIAHIHASFACSTCSVSSDSSNLIPLVADASSSSSSSKDPAPAPSYAGTKTKEEKEQERRDQMATLRGKLLKPAPAPAPAIAAAAGRPSAIDRAPSKQAPFMDRAAARRQRDQPAPLPLPPPASRARPAPSGPASHGSSPFLALAGPPASLAAAARPERADPFGEDSKGARLLSKLSGSGAGAGGGGGGGGAGGEKGGAGGGGGAKGAGLGTLVEARTYGAAGGRTGLGSRPLVVGVEKLGEVAARGRGAGGNASGSGSGGEKRDWRDEGREGSWKRFREGD